MKIMVDGYNLRLTSGTGVATYGRNLIGALKELGHEIGYLTDRRIKPGPSSTLQFYSAQPRVSYKSKLGYLRLAKDLTFPKRRLKLQEFNSRQTALIEFKAMSEAFPEFDFFASRRNLFELAHAYFRLFKRFLPIRLTQRIDVMHWTYPIPIRVIGVKNIYTIHDIIPLKYPFFSPIDLELHHRMLKSIVQNSELIVTVSEQSKKDILQFFEVDENRIINTYQSIDWDFQLSPMPLKGIEHLRNCFDISADKYFLFLGALEPRKNIERLIEAFIMSDVDVPLVLVGPKGWLVHENIIKTVMNVKNIHYFEYLPRNMVQLLMKNAKAVFFPSLCEGFGLPVLEAMKVGTAVVTSDIGSMAEVAGDAAMKVNPYQVVELASAFRALSADNALIQQMIEKGRKQCDKFSGQIYKSKLETLYGKVIAG